MSAAQRVRFKLMWQARHGFTPQDFFSTRRLPSLPASPLQGALLTALSSRWVGSPHAARNPHLQCAQSAASDCRFAGSRPAD